MLRRHCPETVIQSGSIEEDLRILLSARRLVIGHTSFASSVAMLSTNCAASIPSAANLGIIFTSLTLR